MTQEDINKLALLAAALAGIAFIIGACLGKWVL